jgi:hypothetical protein
LGTNSPKLGSLAVANYPSNFSGGLSGFQSINSANTFNLAAFRSPGFLGSHGFGFAAAGNFTGFRDPNQSGFDQNQLDSNTLNLSQGFRHTNNSPINLYLGNSNSPTNNRGDSVESFCYQDSNNRFSKDTDNNFNLNNNNNNNNIHNKKGEEISSQSYENSPRANYNSDSPDLVNNKRGETCSPGESSRSYSSQKNEDIGYNSPLHNNDSIGSQSPENLSSPAKSCNNNYNLNNNNENNNSNNKNHSITEMLDHKLQLSFLGPPLAALHSMTEMKSQNSPQTSQNSQGLQNPHGIDSILSRPTPVTSAQLNALTGGE